MIAFNKKDGTGDLEEPERRGGLFIRDAGNRLELRPRLSVMTEQRAVGLDLKDGKLLWSYSKASNNVANVATPVIRGNRVFLSSDYGTGAGLVEIKADGSAREVDRKDMRNHHSSSILIVYGFSSGMPLTAMRLGRRGKG